MIKVEGLAKKYDGNPVLIDLNFEMEKGKIYGVVGNNGAGKTTLFKCLAGLERCEGKIISSFEVLKDHTGYLETEPVFLSKITGMEYLQLFCNARGIRLCNTESKNIFELPLHRYASLYSSGMKKKLAFMAILLQQNSFYILDEPFNGIDFYSNLLLVEIIKNLKLSGKTILASSHILATLEDVCDEIFILEKGVITDKFQKDFFYKIGDKFKTDSLSEKIERLELGS